MNLSLSEATEFVKAKTPGIKVFIPKLLCYHIHEKSMYIFTETITSFCVFLVSFLEFSYSCFMSFNFSNVVSLALKIHNCTDLNASNTGILLNLIFTSDKKINTLFTGSIGPLIPYVY